MQRLDPRIRKAIKKFQSMHPIKDATKAEKATFTVTTFQSMHPIKDATRGLDVVGV